MCKYPTIKVKLIGEDGNAYAIIGRVQRAMKGSMVVPKHEIEEFTRQARSGDYSNLLATCMDWVTVV
jgi:hypothetical protein